MRNYFVVALYLTISLVISSQTFTSSNLPLILIDTQGKSIPEEPKITSLMKIVNNENGVNKINDKTYEYDGYIGIETRGNTSEFLYEKKSFTIETRTDSGTNRNDTLLGMPAENDWVLQGPYSDKSLIRNALAYHLGNLQGRWSPRVRFCEMFINNEYRGVYVLTEKIKIDKNRVDIATLKAEDISGDELTGGYLLRIDRDRPGCWISPFMGRTGSVDVPISYLDPAYEELTDQQRLYIKDYVTDFEYALDGNNYKDPVLGYRPYIDVVSFIDYFIISELSRNLDGYRCSVYFHKDRDSKGGKLVMSPFWDYDLCFGNADFFDAEKTEGWVADGLGKGDWYEIPFWWDKLRTDPYFNTWLKYRWNELRANSFNEKSINEFIDSCADELDDAQERNFQKFNILNERVWPNSYIGGTYYNEVEYLKNWIADRFYWLDGEINSIVPAFVNIKENETLKNKEQINIYPNPFSEFVSINVNLLYNAGIEIIISDIFGNEWIHEYKKCNIGYNEFIYNSERLGQSNKIYFYTVIIDGSILHTGKLIRNGYK